jgi:5-(carboxyamino)imidazole ribonucleotide mutase
MPSVGIIIGSASDISVASTAADTLREFGVDFEVGIASAHRTPTDVMNYAKRAAGRGVKVIIAMAGLSAALPGVVAAHTTLPVIAVPIASGALSGMDALMASAQMPPGVPVGCVGIDGAKNAALLALRIVGTADHKVAAAMSSWAEKASLVVKQSRKKITEAGMPEAPDEAFK